MTDPNRDNEQVSYGNGDGSVTPADSMAPGPRTQSQPHDNTHPQDSDTGSGTVSTLLSRRQFVFGGVVATAVLGWALFGQRSDGEAIDTSSPKATAESYIRAINEVDVDMYESVTHPEGEAPTATADRLRNVSNQEIEVVEMWESEEATQSRYLGDVEGYAVLMVDAGRNRNPQTDFDFVIDVKRYNDDEWLVFASNVWLLEE